MHVDKMTAGSLFSSLALLLRGESWKDIFQKMAVFPIMQLVPCFEEKIRLLFLNNGITSV